MYSPLYKTSHWNLSFPRSLLKSPSLNTLVKHGKRRDFLLLKVFEWDTWPFFLFTARKYSSNGPTAIFHTFFLAEKCRLLSGKAPLQKSTMTSIDGKIFWQMASLDSRQYVSRNVYLPFIWSYGWEKRWTRIGSNCIWLGSVLTLSDETCRYFALWHFTHFTNDELWTLTKRLYIFFTF